MFTLPYDLQANISEYADLTNYWKRIFTTEILIYINKGYRLTGINTSPCSNCLDNGYLDKNLNCCNCFLQIPCITCWWYNICDEEYSIQCIFCEEYTFLNYKQIKSYLPLKKEYNLYSDFLNSFEWLDTLQEIEDNKNTILNLI